MAHASAFPDSVRDSMAHTRDVTSSNMHASFQLSAKGCVYTNMVEEIEECTICFTLACCWTILQFSSGSMDGNRNGAISCTLPCDSSDFPKVVACYCCWTNRFTNVVFLKFSCGSMDGNGNGAISCTLPCDSSDFPKVVHLLIM